MIIVTVLATNFLGETLRDTLTPGARDCGSAA